MCGIFCVLNSFCNNCDNLISQLKFESNVKRRGPDSFDFRVTSTEESSLALAASVLWLQGASPTTQPLEDTDSIFCYNGDIFWGFDPNVQKTEGDTKLFHTLLKQEIALNSFIDLGKIHGPYAFIFYDKNNKKLYFGRDMFGRRSLLLGQNKEKDTLVLTSVAKRQSEFRFIEVPSVGVFCFDIQERKFNIEFWQHKNKNFYSKLKELEVFLDTEIQTPSHISESELLTHNFEDNSNLILLKSLTENVRPGDVNTDSDGVFETLLNSYTWVHNINNLKNFLEKAVYSRIFSQPEYCKDCVANRLKCKHATTGILFSGGVDCAILAALCHKYVDKSKPIDLLNVSFDEANNYQSPDRVTGLETYKELKACYPNRSWNFVQINVSKETLNEEREKHIADLIYPLNTILDDSLGCALWFASKGTGETYTSPARILIVGMGADELFGGYHRHRMGFMRYSWQGLQELLDEDWMNLPYRNLGRDDRVVSDHGRQLRTPYLDEKVVEFVNSLECWEKSYPSCRLPLGVGEKILLRSLAYQLGLKNAAVLKKRALQFGSRIANPKENAHEVSPRLVF
ncbi:asparagine synthetase domain-containing protein CG17486 [Euwallacea similis]|uniref:asparagine synthetase domain-containing protein CG17486 n=1 Tax=Euwallacea similis TaxID=1736056 RepID=UPI00344D37DC